MKMTSEIPENDILTQGGQFSNFETNLVFFEGALCFFRSLFEDTT